jgi:hypothetical protein
MNTMKTYLSYCLLLGLVIAVPLQAQEAPLPPNPFEGLRGVMIHVEPPAEELEAVGITAFLISTAVEKHLKEAGVPVFPAGDPEMAPGFPAIYVQVIAVFDEFSKECRWAIRVELNQFVRLERNPDTLAVAASTWSVGGLGYQTKDWRQGLINDVLTYTDQFIEAFAAANPDGIEQ